MKKIKDYTLDKIGIMYYHEDKILRAINKEYISQTEDIINGGLMEELLDLGLFPKTHISNEKIDGFSLVLEHQKIDYWNYAYEWSFDMLRDAALLVLKVNSIANKYGYEIKDGHPNNVVFNMNNPLYVDFGSFGKYDSSANSRWISYTQFYNRFYIPLYLWSKGYVDIGKNIIKMETFFDPEEYFKIKHPFLNLILNNRTRFIYKHILTIKEIAYSTNEKIKEKVRSKPKRIIALAIKKSLGKSFRSIHLKNKIISLKKQKDYSMWHDYHDNKIISENSRFIRISEIITNLTDTQSIVELGANQGRFSEYLLKYTHIKKIIATDYDNEAVNIMYLNNKSNSQLLPLLFDVMRPETKKSENEIKDRFKSDIVLALALTHHLILKQYFPIEHIFKTMKNLTNKYIIVEFMPRGLYAKGIKVPPLPDYYNLEWFRENFLKHFDLILDEELELNRHLFLGKIKIKS